MTISERTDLPRPTDIRGKSTIWLAAAVLLPIIAISLLGRHYSHLLTGIVPADLTNFGAVRSMISGVMGVTDIADSWLPMTRALQLLHGENANRLYEELFFSQTIRFQYPPTSLLPMELLSTIGINSVLALNRLNFLILCLNAAGTGVIAWLLFSRTLGLKNEIQPQSSCGGAFNTPAVIALTVLATFLFYPLARAQVLGQIQVWIDALFTLALICWLIERRFLAGLCIGLACAIKPQFALLLVWGLLWKEAAFVAGFLAAAVPIAGLSLFRYGLHNNLAYLDVLSFLSKHGESFFANNSVNGILNGYLSPNDPHHWDPNSFTPYVTAIYVGSLLAAAITFALIVLPRLLYRRFKPDLALFGAASICLVVGSPVAWEHHYGILLPLYLVALKHLMTTPLRQDRLFLALLWVSWVLVANFIPFTLLFGGTALSFFQAHCFFGALLLLLVLLTLWHRQASVPLPAGLGR
jgi:alpha-1,2-mannosyltransferase